MSLMDKYAAVLKLGQDLKVKGSDVKEQGGKLIIKGTAEYGIDRDHLWDLIKKQAGWESEIVADIKVEKTDVYGYWTVKPGDSLSKIAKDVYDDGSKYTKIYEANKATIGDNPNLIKPGQKLALPNK
ncbi:MAG TPA: LysM peptidoglycan-binding domain-containing protein [Vicinamibacteria bacterium]|nr:LysM peptidoglycan-binding domain-containing protein [Vicinamibacteria bacterium]